MNKKYSIFLFLFCIITLTGCISKEVDVSKLYEIYYISNSETKLEVHKYEMESVSKEEQLKELLECLGAPSEKVEYKAPLAMGFTMLNYDIKDGKVTLNMSQEYNKLSPTTEVLVRAAIVNTLTQLSDINFVGFMVEGNPLYDNLGNLVGMMNADQFMNNEGSSIHGYEKVQLKLYFASETRDSLIAVKRTKTYNTNVSMEKLVVEELIKGPGEDLEGVYPTINPETRIVSNVMVKDGNCYVNLNEAFLNQTCDVTPDVTIYSIVNSLMELSNVNKVQISINGETTDTFGGKYSLGTVFERNLDIVTTLEK